MKNKKGRCEMCRQRVALEFINNQNDKGGLSGAALLLHEEQCKDFESMQKQINEIKSDVSEIKQAQQDTNKKIDEITELIKNKLSLKQSIKDILNNKIFLYILITIFAASMGVSVAELGIPLLK